MSEVGNVIIVGGGPAGYTAAIYLARATMAPLMFAGESAGGQLMWTTEVENYPGFSKGIMGPVLMDEMKEQAAKFGAEIQNINVTKMDLSGDIKKVWVNEQEYQSRAVILTLGAQARMLGIGEEKYLGRGVSTCAVCDAAFFKDKRVTVVGGGDAAMEDALALARFALSVDIVHRRDSFRASKIMQERVKANSKINVLWNSEVTGVEGDGVLRFIELKTERTSRGAGSSAEPGQELKKIQMDGLFLAIGHTPVTDLLKGQVELDNHGYLITELTSNKENKNQDVWLNAYPTQTSVKGVFGAGDMVDLRYRQAVTAAGMGCMAALDCEKYLTGSAQSW